MKYLICLLTLLTACVNSQKVYIVGTDAEFPPFGYYDNGVLTGYDIEFFEALAKDQGIQFKWVNMDFKGIIPALETKKIDIIVASMVKTPERAKNVLFTDPYGADDEFQHLVGLSSSPDLTTGSLDEVKGKKIGIVLGHRAESFASAVEGLEIVSFNSVAATFMALQSGKIDYVFTAKDTAKGFLKENKGLKSFPIDGTANEMCMAVRLGDEELTKKLNKGIANLKANGTFKTLYDKYLSQE